MDIEKLIRRLRNDADAYRNGETLGRAFADQEDVLDAAATALSTLQAENEKLRAELEQKEKYYEQMVDALSATESFELEQVKAERDAAITDLKKWSICATCKNYCPRNKSTHCRVKRAYLPGGNWAGCSKWKWRGIKEEDRP